MLAFSLFFALVLGLPDNASSKEESHYKSYRKINAYLKEMADTYSEVATLEKIGTSKQNRDLFVLVIGGQKERSIYINSAHHGNEKASVAASLGLIEHLLEKGGYFENNIFSSFNLYIQPLVNPDGYESESRYNSMGIDLNRDYAHPLRDKQDAFFSLETQAVRDFMKKTPFKGALAIHSGMEGVLWPWCYTKLKNTHIKNFEFLGTRTAMAMGLFYYRQSSFDYISSGEFIDYAYMEYKTYGLTLEVSNLSAPSSDKLKGIVEKTINGTKVYLENLETILDRERNS